jgi:hypothetical protein
MVDLGHRLLLVESKRDRELKHYYKTKSTVEWCYYSFCTDAAPVTEIMDTPSYQVFGTKCYAMQGVDSFASFPFPFITNISDICKVE